MNELHDEVGTDRNDAAGNAAAAPARLAWEAPRMIRIGLALAEASDASVTDGPFTS